LQQRHKTFDEWQSGCSKHKAGTLHRPERPIAIETLKFLAARSPSQASRVHATTSIAALFFNRIQRLQPVAVSGPTHADWHLAVVGPSKSCGLERQLYEALRS